MGGQRWVPGAVAAVVFASTGCVSCADKCYRKGIENAAECEQTAACRKHLYVYMIHGVTPSTDCGLEALQYKLSACGFAKIGVGECASAPLLYFEIKHTLKCDPDARFVLVGYDFGAAAAVCLARELGAKGVPVEALVLLDPLACGAPGVRTLVITSGTTTTSVPCTEHVVVSDAGHFKLPAHPRTAEAITDLLKDVAVRTYQDPGDPIPYWSYKHAPEMHTAPLAPGAPDWNFLADTSEIPPGINPPAGTQATQQFVPAPPSTSAGPVLIRKD
jgi:hypothetical protein